jgi:hypothetical protein
MLFPIVPILIFIFIIIYIFYAQKPQPAPPQPQQNAVTVSPSNSPSTSESPSQGDESENEPSGDNTVTDPLGNGALDKEVLPDGSIRYDYESDSDDDDDVRPDIKIFKNGVIVFQRTYLSESYMKDFPDLINNPEYTSMGSQYYGQYVETYADPTKGTAIVAAPQIGLVLEQYTFPPLSVTAFTQKYGTDISSYGD